MNNRDMRLETGGQKFCLGDTPHLAEGENEVCRICGALVQDALLGSYQIKRLLGSGRSGQAYLAIQQRQPQPVVIKVFPPDPASQHLWEYAWRETSQLAALRHRSILPVLNCTLWNPKTRSQVGFQDKTVDISYLSIACQYTPVTFYALFSPGGSGKLRAMRLPPRHLLHLILQGAAALTLVHDLGLAHGALVPGNFLLSAQLDQLWIADFGLARLHPPVPPFLAPELVAVSEICRQRRDMAPYWGAVTAASDQFAFALICYQLFVRAAAPNVVERIKPVIQHASQPEPAQRFAHIAEFVNALATVLAVEQLLAEEPTTPSSSGPITSPIPKNKRQSDNLNMAMSSADPFPTNAQQSSAHLPAVSATRPDSGPFKGADQWEQIAGKCFAAHDYEGAEQAYMQATRLEPGMASAWLGLGDAYFALERYIDALGAYGKTLDLDPNNIDGWFNRGTVLDALGRTEQAALDYERADQLRSEATRRSK